MRWTLTVALVCSLCGCRRADPVAQPAAGAAPEAATAAPPSIPPAQDAPVVEAPPEKGEKAPSPPSAPAVTLSQADAPARSAAPADPPPDDQAMYRWEDAEGVIHFGSADEVPDAHRRSARPVNAGVTIVPPVSLTVSPSTAAPAAPPQPEPTDEPVAEGRGPMPRLDAQGLPIPGTMNDTAATRAARARGELQIDPAAVERRRQEELRRMNCREKDGVWICG